MSETTHSSRSYFITYVALLALLVLTVALSFVDIGRDWNNAIAMGIGAVKCVLIILIFMHVRFQPWVTWFFAGAGFLWLGIMLTLTLSEYYGRNHPPHGGPKGEPVFVSSESGRN